MHGLNAETAAFPYHSLSRFTLCYRRHDLNRQVIGPHLKGKTGILCHTITADDAAIFTHWIPVLPVFHGREDVPDHGQGRVYIDTFFNNHYFPPTVVDP
jgi:hypothetical protein